MAGILSAIVENKRREIEELRKARFAANFSPRPLTLRREPHEPLRLITEIKLRSPSAGSLSTRLSVAERAAAYERGGASMISVLCDRRFFDGSYEHLEQARAACSLPLLCKEFILDPIQLDAAVAHGADAVLLIVRCLSADLLRTLVVESRSRGLSPLVEIHGEAELELALAAGAELIGVNARDLDTLQMDVAGAAKIVQELPPNITAVHLSGVKDTSDIAALRRGRADAVLLGEALMRQDDPTVLLQSLAVAAHD
jgi:indole-3-glycerol phosphate synthase